MKKVIGTGVTGQLWVARKMVSTTSAMWKTDSKFDKKLF
jgi:hypothetical protein